MGKTIQVAADAVQEAEDGKVSVTLPDTVVTEDEVRENFVPRDVHQKLQDNVESRMQSAAEKAVEKARSELVRDDDFLETAIKEREEWFQQRFPTDTDVDPKEVISQVREQEVKPLREELEAERELAGNLKQSAVQGSVERAMSANRVKDDHREMVEAMVLRRVQWSDEYNQTVVLDESGQVRTKLDDGKMRPLTPNEYVGELRASGKYDAAFEAGTRDGSGFDPGEGGGSGNLDDRIAALEAEGKFAEAGELKSKKLQEARKKGL